MPFWHFSNFLHWIFLDVRYQSHLSYNFVVSLPWDSVWGEKSSNLNKAQAFSKWTVNLGSCTCLGTVFIAVYCSVTNFHCKRPRQPPTTLSEALVGGTSSFLQDTPVWFFRSAASRLSTCMGLNYHPLLAYGDSRGLTQKKASYPEIRELDPYLTKPFSLFSS